MSARICILVIGERPESKSDGSTEEKKRWAANPEIRRDAGGERTRRGNGSV